MDDVVDLIDRFADRGHPRGAQRVLDDARRGTVALERQSPAPAPRRRGRIAIAVLAGVVVVGAAFLAGRDNSQPDPADRNSDTVLDGVSDADAAELCKAFAPLSAEANQSRSALDPETSASVAEQYLDLAEQARAMGAIAFAESLTESSTQLALFAKQNLDLIDGDEPTTTMTQEQFRVGILRLRRSDTELELACTARGHDPIFGQQSGSSDTPPTTATR
jgi:hypothetical protein